MVGADLANLVNEAALLAARRGHERVNAADFADALEKIVLGTVRGIMLSPRRRERTAYHESGHALLGMLTPGADPVRKVSIIPRGRALGRDLPGPGRRPVRLLGEVPAGPHRRRARRRAAEEMVYGDVTTGAESDLDQVSSIARQMVGRWGMSDAIGPVTVLPPPGQESPLGLDGVAPATKELIDREVRRIVDECYDEALATLARTASSWTGWRTRCSRRRRSTRTRRTPRRASRDSAPGALARGEVPGVSPEPGYRLSRRRTGRANPLQEPRAVGEPPSPT